MTVFCFRQVSVKYRVDPRSDRDMLEGCPLLKKISGRRFVPVGLHIGRFTGEIDQFGVRQGAELVLFALCFARKSS